MQRRAPHNRQIARFVSLNFRLQMLQAFVPHCNMSSCKAEIDLIGNAAKLLQMIALRGSVQFFPQAPSKERQGTESEVNERRKNSCCVAC